jgi:hypothetical protein
MAIDTFFVFTGTYPDVATAEADYDAVKRLHTDAELIDAYDAAVVEHRTDESRSDLKELGEQLDAGTAGLVVVGVSDMESKIEASMAGAEKIDAKQPRADTDEIEKDAASD